MNCDIAISSLHIELREQRPIPELRDHADNLIHFDVSHSKVVKVDAIVHTIPRWRREVHNQAPFPGLAVFRNYAKTAYL